MKARFLALALLASACTPQTDEPLQIVSTKSSDGAGNTMEPLLPASGAITGWRRLCTEGGVWCVSTPEGDAPQAQILHTVDGETKIVASLQIAAEDSEVWPWIVRQPRADGGEAVLVGFTETLSEGYSGGGAAMTRLVVYALSNGAEAEVLTIQIGGSANIRACFDEDDRRARRDACADEYKFDAVLALDPANTSSPPRLILTTEAATFPGPRSRDSDSTMAPPLRAGDLVWTRDETCSYRRVFTREAGGMYAPDQPLPECTDYQTQ